jgi:hypothetical protein
LLLKLPVRNGPNVGREEKEEAPQQKATFFLRNDETKTNKQNP